MTAAIAPDTKAQSWNFEAYAIGGAVTTDGRTFAVALGDGTLRLITDGEAEPRTVQAHDGACLCLVTDIDGRGFLTGGDDGKLVRTDSAGTMDVLADLKGKWIEHVTAHAGSGYRAYAAGKDAYVMDRKAQGAPRKLTHATSVGGLAINDKGKRLAVSHYNGVSLWWLASQDASAQVLEWKGSHLNVLFSRDSDYVVTALQENALHGWRLSDKQHMRMTGYGAKVRAMSFSRKGHVLATGGADTVICWPFTGGGPMGKAPLEFGGGVTGPGKGAPVTAVLCNPKLDMIAAGFANGAVILGQPGGQRAFPLILGPGTPITTLCWDPNGNRLLVGDESGGVALMDFREIDKASRAG
jgi:WD40 repeat protein